MTALETDALAKLISAKRECLRQLRQLGRKQSDLIEGGEITALLDVLAAKQRPLIELQRIERALDRFRDQDPDRRRWRTPRDRQLCAEQLQQCEALLSEIVSQEKCSEAALIRRRDEAASRLQGAHLAQRASGAYGGQMHGVASQLDLSSDT